MTCLIGQCLRITVLLWTSQVADQPLLDLHLEVAGHAVLAVHVVTIWGQSFMIFLNISDKKWAQNGNCYSNYSFHRKGFQVKASIFPKKIG
jgi:hypothetical protein